MEREELRAAQAPLKERYKDDPGAAVVTLAASGELGEGSLLCSGDMLLEALVAFQLDTDADPGQLEPLLKLTERYCVVFQTIAGSPRLSASFKTT
jgi:hypothetical protein